MNLLNLINKKALEFTNDMDSHGRFPEEELEMSELNDENVGYVWLKNEGDFFDNFCNPDNAITRNNALQLRNKLIKQGYIVLFGFDGVKITRKGYENIGHWTIK